jgi:hypothetical protein
LDKSVSEPYGVYEYDVPLSTAELIVSGEVERCNAINSKYTPAVVEIERQLRWTDQRLFRPGIRFVDTQGLDQQLPEDLKTIAQEQPGATTMDRFDQWIKHTPRGRHLDWQYRRCDAALWCVHAKRIGSAVSTASMQYFRKYGKKTVIALTNIDRFREGLQTVLHKAEETYSGAADFIIPVSGKAALEASLRGDSPGLVNSGLRRLVETLIRLCVTEGSRNRIVSQYVSLRTTEAQLRQALRVFVAEIEATLGQLQTCRDSVRRTMRRVVDDIEQKLEASNRAQIAFVRKNLAGLELTDNGYSALVRMKPDDARTRHETEASQATRSALDVADLFARQLAAAAFRLPIFDADGKRAGDSVSVQTQLVAPIFRFERTDFQIQLEGMFLKDVQLWWREKVLGWFSEAARNKAAAERSRLERERREDAARQFGTAWERYHSTMLAECRRGITSVFDEMLKAIDVVQRDLEQIEGEPLSATQTRLISVLGHICIPPAIVGTVVERVRAVISGARGAKRDGHLLAGRTRA